MKLTKDEVKQFVWTSPDNTLTYEKQEDLPLNIFGFIYEIGFPDGTKYIGKKQVQMITRHKKLRQCKYYLYTNAWKYYIGSSKEITKPISYRHILEFAYSKRELTYLEAKWLFKLEVLESDKYRNRNILATFYKGNIK